MKNVNDKKLLEDDNSYYCENCDKYYLADDVDWQNDTPICPNCETKINL